MNTEAIKDLLYRMADDELIYAHRNAEWTGLAPTLEEDIAFSSIAQDKFGHAQALYAILETLGEKDPDTIAFTRTEKEFRCCQFVEFETMDYAVGLMRHFLFDTAEKLRFTALETSSYGALSQLARKIKGEIKYHIFHANTWVHILGADGSEESHVRMQAALNECMPIAYSMFEHCDADERLKADGVYPGEEAIQQQWLVEIQSILSKAKLTLPTVEDTTVHYGGRRGYHSDALAGLLTEMTEVFRIDPTAQW